MWRWCPACRCLAGSSRRRLPYRRIAAAASLSGSRAVPRAVCPKPQAPEAQRRCPLGSVSSRTQVTPPGSGEPSPHLHLRCCARPDDPQAHPLLGISGIAPVSRVGSITDRTPRYRRFWSIAGRVGDDVSQPPAPPAARTRPAKDALFLANLPLGEHLARTAFQR